MVPHFCIPCHCDRRRLPPPPPAQFEGQGIAPGVLEQTALLTLIEATVPAVTACRILSATQVLPWPDASPQQRSAAFPSSGM